VPTDAEPDPTQQPDPPDPQQRPATADAVRWRRVARWLVGLEALAPAAGAVYFLVALLAGNAIVARNEVMLVVVLAVAAAGLAVVAHGVGHGRRAVRTPSLVWQVLLVLAVAGNLWQAGRQPLAVAVLLLAVATGYATVRATSDDRDAPGSAPAAP
jgi:hypothetical protein